MNMAQLKAAVLAERFDDALGLLDMTEHRLSAESRRNMAQVCREIAADKGFGKAVELVIGLSRKLGFLIADPEIDVLQTIEVPMQSGSAIARLEFNPRRAARGDIKSLTAHGIIDPGAPEDSWMYEKWSPDRKGNGSPLVLSAYGWGRKQQDSIKCFLCSGLGEDREKPVNPNEIFIVCEGPDGPVYAGCNFAALAPYHMTAFRKEPYQQAVDQSTLGRTLAILDNLQKGCDPAKGPFTVIHNGDLICRVTGDGKTKMVGVGATLMHDHNQFMRSDLPMARAGTVFGRDAVGLKLAVLDWASSVIRVEGGVEKRAALLEQTNRIIAAWQKKNPENTSNLIVTRRERTDVVFVALRRIGMVDAPEKSCVASLEQSGIIVLDDRPVFEKYLAATAGERLKFVTGVLACVDPVLKDAGGSEEKRSEELKKMIGA